MAEKRNAKAINNLKKLYLFILLLAIIVFVLKYFIDKYAIEEKDIYSLIGNSVSTSIGSKNALYIREYAIVPFANLLKNSQYEEAYNMCSNKYKEFFTLEDFTNDFSIINASTLAMKDIKAQSDYCYEAKIVYYLKGEEQYSYISGDSGEAIQVANNMHETSFMLFPNEFNTTLIKISPNKFLYGYKDVELKKSGIEVNVSKCYVYTDHVDLEVNLKNVSWFSDIQIDSIALGYDTALLRRFNYDTTLKKGEETKLVHTIDKTYYFMPNNIQIECIVNENKSKTHIFYLDNEK